MNQLSCEAYIQNSKKETLLFINYWRMWIHRHQKQVVSKNKQYRHHIKEYPMID